MFDITYYINRFVQLLNLKYPNFTVCFYHDLHSFKICGPVVKNSQWTAVWFMYLVKKTLLDYEFHMLQNINEMGRKFEKNKLHHFTIFEVTVLENSSNL